MKEMDLDFGDEAMRMSMSMDEESIQDPIELIKGDHRKVEALFKQFEQTEDKRMKLQLAKTICQEVTVHALLEEELIYPLLRGEEEEEMGEEGYTEHELVKYMISEVESLGARDKALEPKMKVLKELIEHHVKEEEGEMLPELEDNEELQGMKEQIMQRKSQLIDMVMKKGMKSKPSQRGARGMTTSKSSPKKASSKKAVPKKAAPKKTAAKKTTAKKAAPKKVVAKKAAPKKAMAKKPVAKKGSSKRTTSKRSR